MRKSIKTMLLLASVLVAPISTAVVVPVHAEEPAPAVDAKRQEFVNSLRQLKVRLDGLQTKTDAQASKKSDLSFDLKEAIASVTATDEDIYRLEDAKHDKKALINQVNAFITEVQNYKAVDVPRQQFVESLKALKGQIDALETKTDEQNTKKSDIAFKLKEAIASVTATDEDIYRLADAKHDKAGLIADAKAFIEEVKNYKPVNTERQDYIKSLKDLQDELVAVQTRTGRQAKFKDDLVSKLKEAIASVEATDEDIYRLADAKHDKAELVKDVKEFLKSMKLYVPDEPRLALVKDLKELKAKVEVLQPRLEKNIKAKDALLFKIKDHIDSIEATDEDIYMLENAKEYADKLVANVNELKDAIDAEIYDAIGGLDGDKLNLDLINEDIVNDIKKDIAEDNTAGGHNRTITPADPEKPQPEPEKPADEDKKPNISDVLAGLDGDNLVLDGLNEDVVKDIKKDFTNEPSEDKKPNIQDILSGLDGDKLVLDGLNEDVVNDIKNDFTKVSDNSKPNNVVSQAKPVNAQNVQKAKLPQTAILVTSPYLMALAALGAGYIKRKRK